MQFNGDTPHVSACNGDKIILEYQGKELTVEDAIERMEEYGYITPDDFI